MLGLKGPREAFGSIRVKATPTFVAEVDEAPIAEDGGASTEDEDGAKSPSTVRKRKRVRREFNNKAIPQLAPLNSSAGPR